MHHIHTHKRCVHIQLIFSPSSVDLTSTPAFSIILILCDLNDLVLLRTPRPQLGPIENLPSQLAMSRGCRSVLKSHLPDQLLEDITDSNIGLCRALDEQCPHSIRKCLPFLGRHLPRELLTMISRAIVSSRMTTLTLSTLLPTKTLTTPSPQYVSSSRNHLNSSSNVDRDETSYTANQLYTRDMHMLEKPGWCSPSTTP